MLAYSSGVPHWRAAEAAMVARAGVSGPVMSWWRPLPARLRAAPGTARRQRRSRCD